MVRRLPAHLAFAAVAAVLTLAAAGIALGAPLGTAFTYQGQLRQAGLPVNGTCDLQFSLFDAATGGGQVGATQEASGVALIDGRFTVQLDFGGAAFDGTGRWLQVAARCPAGSGGFTSLDPRQPLTPAPYALFATGATTATNFSGSLAGDVTGSQGSTLVARLQGRDVVNAAPVDGAVLRFNGAQNRWEPTVPVDVNAGSYLFAYSLATQAVAQPSQFRTVLLESTGLADGWAVDAGTGAMTAPAGGVYAIQYGATAVNASSTVYISLRITRNGLEIPGSQSGHQVVATVANHVATSLLAPISAGDVLRLQVTSEASGSMLVGVGLGSSLTSASVTITRVR